MNNNYFELIKISNMQSGICNFGPKKHNGKMRDYYKIYDQLGTGAYGEVRLCVYREDMKDKRNSMKSYRAVKILSKAYMEQKDFKAFLNEVKVMSRLYHPSIIKMHHYFEDSARFLLITDVCKGGDLFSLIRDRKQFDKQDSSVILKQILSAIAFMHEMKIVHRDLKPENVML
jgi:calcium-dependent protein kinase